MNNPPKKEARPKAQKNYPFYTIGHSTRPLEEFAGILKSLNISLVVDVRTVPRSRTNPQYNRDVMPALLRPFHIKYQHIPLLGGLRGRSPGISDDVNAFWYNKSFRYYADYAMGDDFQEGLTQLIECGRKNRCAIMCAEVLWWRCHRRIITDYLLAAKEQVFHIISEKSVQKARMTDAAKRKRSGKIIYPAVSP